MAALIMAGADVEPSKREHHPWNPSEWPLIRVGAIVVEAEAVQAWRDYIDDECAWWAMTIERLPDVREWETAGLLMEARFRALLMRGPGRAWGIVCSHCGRAECWQGQDVCARSRLPGAAGRLARLGRGRA